MKIINKKIISIILLFALVISSNGISTLASQSDVFNIKEDFIEQIAIENDDEEIESVEKIDNSRLILEEETTEQEEEGIIVDLISTESEINILDDSNEIIEATTSIIYALKSTESETVLKVKRNFGHLEPDIIAPIAKLNKSNTFGLPEIPSSYDARNEKNSSNMSIVSPIRKQGSYGTCWAFSTIGMIETSIRKQDLVDNEDDSNLSEAALAYFVYNLENVTNSSNASKPTIAGRDYAKINVNATAEDWSQIGGNPISASLALSTYMGAVKENEDTKYSKMEDIRLNGLDGKYAYNNNDFEILNSLWINKANRDLVKQAIMENGSAGISYCENRNFDNCHKHGNDFYYFSGEVEPNHDVMIVGWDDNISKDWFVDANGNKPTIDGGWLVRNSWGLDDDGWIDNKGYFWITYEDASIEDTIYSIKATKADTYKYNYHYDSTGAQFNEKFKKTWAAANVFKVSDDEDQTLDAISFPVGSANTNLNVEVYTKATEMENPLDGTKQLSQKVTKDSAGLYTIVLDKKIPLTKGTYFSIMITNEGDDEIVMVIDGVTNSDSAKTHYYNEVETKQSYFCVPSMDYCDDNYARKKQINGVNYGYSYRIKALTNPADNSGSSDSYTLKTGWYDETKSGKPSTEITSIKIMKYPQLAPTEADASWDIDGSNGLKCYRKGTEVTIYAAENKTIYAAEDGSMLFSGGDFDGTNYTPNQDKQFTKCEQINGLELLDTSKTTNMQMMFLGLGVDNMYNAGSFPRTLVSNPKKINLDISSFNTEKVVSMNNMFDSSAIETVNIGNLDNRSLTTTWGMFGECALLKSLDLKGFDTKAITNASAMFVACESLESIEFSDAAFENATDLSYMFQLCSSLTSLDLSGFKTSKVTNMEEMFSDCVKLKTITVSSNFVTTAVTNSNNMFNGCTTLVGGNNTAYVDTNPKDKTYAIIDGTDGKPGYFTKILAKEYVLAPIWYDDTLVEKSRNSITKITILKYPTAAPTSFDKTWDIQGSNGLIGYIKDTEVTIYAPKEGTIFMADDSAYLFSNSSSLGSKFSKLQSIENLNYLDTSRVRIMKGMFSTCQALRTLDVSNFDTSIVSDMSEMFYYCRSLTNLNVRGFDTAEVTTFESMFAYCLFLSSIDVSRFNTSKATSLESMFYNCASLVSIDVSNFDTREVTTMEKMFSNCLSLESLDLSSFNTSKLTGMGHMFYFANKNNTSLKSIDLRSFDTKEVTSMAQLFYNCSKLEKIIASNKFVTTKLTVNMSDLYMFEGCDSLKGGNNTVYDSNYVDKLYARVDGAKGLPGYFTGSVYYNVSFDMKGHGTQVSNQSIVEDGLITKPTDPTETGFEFKGWYENEQYTTVFDFTKEITKETVIYAKWEPFAVYYDVSFDMKGHGANISAQKVKEGEKVTKPTDPTETGYEFKGWYENEQYTTEFDFNSSITKKTVIYAKWNENEYNITYHMDNGSWKQGAQYKTKRLYTESITLPTSADIEKVVGQDTYEFAGWWTQDGTNNQWGEQVLNIPANTAENKEVYAKWKSTVSFNANGHGTAPNSVEITGSTGVLLQGLTATGYIFDGWYDGADWRTSIKVGDANQTVTFTGPKILYAKWSPITYTINYNTNDGTMPAGTNNNFTKTYGEPKTLASPSKIGYKFAGWFSDSNLTTKYNGDIDLSTTNGDTKDIYASWTPITYVLKFYSDGLATTPSEVVKTYGQALQLPTLTGLKTGYTFNKWICLREVDTSGNLTYWDISQNMNHDISYYYDEVSHNRVDVVQDAVVNIYPMFKVTMTYINGLYNNAKTETTELFCKHYVGADNIRLFEPLNVESLTPDNLGYTFDGYYEDSNFIIKVGKGGDSYNPIQTTLYAKWNPNTYTVNYNLQGVGATLTNNSFTKIYETPATLINPTNIPAGYEFLGWYKETTYTNSWDGQTDLTKKQDDDKTIYAKWKRAVVFNVSNNGKNINATQPNSIEITAATTITLPNTSATGYTFGGWYREAGLINFVGMNGVGNIAVSEPTTFYAKWSPITYSINYNTNDGTMPAGTNNNFTKTYGEPKTLASPSKTGYKFAGWFSDSNLTTKYNGDIDLSTTNGDTKDIYAKWDAITYIIKYEVSGHATSIQEKQKTYGKPYTLPTPVAAEGYTFDGWFKENTYVNTYDGQSDLSSIENDEITIYARFKARITFNTNGHGSVNPEFVDVVLNQTTILPTLTNVTGWTFDTTNSWYNESSCTTLIGQAGSNYTVTAPKTIYAKWNENEYNVTYHMDNGSWKQGAQYKTKRLYTESITLPTSADIEKIVGQDTYEFAGWWTQDGTNNQWGEQVLNIPANTAENKEVYAKWKSTVSFNANGHGTAPNSVEITGSTQVILQGLTATGYIFDGWYSSATEFTNANFIGNANQTVTFTGPKILYAKWNPITYTINYNTNDGTLPAGTNNNFTKTYGEPKTLASPSKTGYKFAGWFSDSNLTIKYNGNTDLSITNGDTKDIYAKWDAISYSIKYNIPANVTATAPAQYTKYYNQNYSPANPTNVASGFRFVSWHTAPAFTDDNKYVGNRDLSTTENDDITLYSKWEVSLTYNANGYGVAPANEWVELQKSIKLASPTETTKGVIFDGWFSDPTGGTSYGSVGADYTVNAPIVAYAHWTERSFDIEYHNITNTDFVVGYTAPTSRKYSETKILPTADNLSRVGYIFDGWYENDTYTGNKITSAPANFVGKKEYWAKWNEKEYNITLNENGGVYVSGYTIPNKRKYTESKILPTNDNIKKTGYTLAGWYPNSDYSGAKATEVAANQDVHFVFYAKWVPSEYNVTLHTNGGTINTGNVTKHTYGIETTLPTDITKNNSIFRGWWTKDGTNGDWGQQVTIINKTEVDDKEFYAKWAESIEVIFNLGGKGTNITKKVESGTKVERPTDPTFADYEFINWYTDNTYTNLYDFNTIITSQKEIWARWQQAVTYAVSFDVTNGGADIGAIAPDVQNIKEGKKATRPANPTTTGWTFDAWYKESSYQNKYLFTENITEPTTIYAKWTENKYKINYNVNGGTWAQGTNVVTERKYTEQLTLLTTITKKYHTFGGWYESSTYDGSPITTIPSNTDKEITIYAKWIPDNNTYTITFNSNYNGETLEEVFSNTEDIALRTDIFKRDGWTFSYWRDANGNKIEKSNTSLSGLVLYAEWTKNPTPTSAPTSTTRGGNSVSGIISGNSAVPQLNQFQGNNSNRVDNYRVHAEIIRGEQFILDPVTNKMKVTNQNMKAGFYNMETGGGLGVYCIDENGNMKTGFVEYQGDVYYMDERQINLGRMFVGEIVIDNYKFVFDAFGKCISGKENYQQVLAKKQAEQELLKQQQALQSAQLAQQVAQQTAIQTALYFAQFNKANAWNSIINMIKAKPFLIQ